MSPGSDDGGGADLETLAVDPSIVLTREVAPKRRSGRPATVLPWVLATAAIAVISVAILDDGRTAPRPEAELPTTPSSLAAEPTIPQPVAYEQTLRAGEQKCPADRAFADSLAHATLADMTSRGAADGLPEDGATTVDRVIGAARDNGAEIRKSHPDVIAITVGPGLGWTFSQRAGPSIAYRKVNDFQVVVHLHDEQDCPSSPSFVSNARGQRVPSLYVYESIR